MTREGRINLFGWIATILCTVCTINAMIALNHSNYLGGAILLAGSWGDGILALVAYEKAWRGR